MTRRLRVLLAAAMAALLALAFVTATRMRGAAPEPVARLRLPEGPAAGFASSLPVLWAEAADMEALLGPDQPVHPLRPLVEAHVRPVPLDVLSKEALVPFDRLLLVQPRPLAPAELVALDAWVRAGGRLLLFADPLLLAESEFGLGDPRRPEGATMLSPLFGHWGLAMSVGDGPGQPVEQRRLAGGAVLAVRAPGRLEPTGEQCTISSGGLLARCALGRGEAVIVADADCVSPELLALDGQAATILRLLAVWSGKTRDRP